MRVTVNSSEAVPADAEVVGIPVLADGSVPAGAGVPAALDGDVLRRRGFEGKVGETLPLASADNGPTVVAVGMGPADRITPETLRRGAAALVRSAGRAHRLATTLLAAAPATLEPRAAGQALAEGFALGAYRYTRYKSKATPPALESVTVATSCLPGDGGAAAVAEGIQQGTCVAEAVALARDLVNEPATAMTPRRLVEVATEVADRSGMAISVLDEEGIARERLGGLAGVALGSVEPARLITLTYDPPGATAAVAFVGKGITFDSGGLSIKTADGMETMKTDMSGAAAVLASMSTLRDLGATVKVMGIIPATENMPGGRAMKPGDVLTIRNGKTVEVLNTDAEGRLVLADGLSLAVEAGVDAVVDVATLTGACMIALGRKVAGLMANSDAWRDQVQAAAERAGEPVWPLPLPDDYRSLIDSEIADIKNIGGRWAGALTAGLFLKEFVGDVPWAHLDIAGPARSEEDSGYVTKGGTGFAVRTLIETALSYQPV